MGLYTVEKGLKYELYGNKKTTQKRATAAVKNTVKKKFRFKPKLHIKAFNYAQAKEKIIRFLEKHSQ